MRNSIHEEIDIVNGKNGAGNKKKWENKMVKSVKLINLLKWNEIILKNKGEKS